MMAQQVINVGTTPDDGKGDKLRPAFIKANANFTELYGVVPTTQTGATYTVGASDTDIIANNAAGTLTLVLPLPASFPGRPLRVKTIQARAVVSASSNVVPLIGGAPGTALLAATAGTWAHLKSDGLNWIIMSGN